MPKFLGMSLLVGVVKLNEIDHIEVITTNYDVFVDFTFNSIFEINVEYNEVITFPFTNVKHEEVITFLELVILEFMSIKLRFLSIIY